MDRIIGIDPGSEESGMVVLDGPYINSAFILKNEIQLYDKVTNFSVTQNLTVVIEDIKPYSLQLTPSVIDTCKVIGEIVYVIGKQAGLPIKMVSRYDVKRWCFDTFPSVCLPLIDSKIEKKMWDACNVETKELVRVDSNGRGKRKPSFVYCDDKIMTECMKFLYKIDAPKPGFGYLHGLKTHAWQALAVASCYRDYVSKRMG